MSNGIMKIRTNAISGQVQNVLDFALRPGKGMTETIDNAIATFRKANRAMLETVGVKV